ncbi:MAG: FAD-dependent oxidoreductase [Erysipelotrichaceae bacterium]|nr:FAD-dependent oxidoreductase [Erysipelotrichaceae bacterium]
MPEIYRDKKETISQYEGEQDFKKKYAKLARKITDNVENKILGVKSTDPEYWGLREILNEDEVDILLTMKQRKWYTYEQLYEKQKGRYDPIKFKELVDLMCVHGIVEYDYGDHYNDDGPIKDAPKEKRYRLSYFVPGSAELFNSSKDRIERNPAVTSFFERMTFLPLEKITSMVPQGGDGIGMHVIPVEKEVSMNNEAIKLEKISYWLNKYDGHISAGICSCRQSRAVLGEGCTDDADDWCIQVGDMADYTVETGRAHYITKERALEILKKAEENGYVHQITNIDGEDHIFDICNCNVKICNALRTSLLYNTPNLSRSAYTASVDKEKCVACGMCVEVCPAGAVKLGQKLCAKDGTQIEYPKAVLPDRIRWGKYAWDENYRDTARVNTHKTGTSPCKAACPAHVPVQGYLKMAHEGRYDEALALIKRENPFPAICGRVCNKRCEDACTRGTIDRPVSIDEVKKFLAERDLHAETRYVPEKVVNNLHGHWDQKIAIIGAGPAGLSCAYYLATMGYSPTVFEKNEKPGGMMTYGIPAYKLAKDVIDAEIDIIRQLGVEIRCGVEVGRDITIQQLKEQGYEAFYIAIGCQGGKRPGVANDTAEGTEIAVSFLKDALGNPDQKIEGDVVVVGGGNVAIDCARTAHRFGPDSVSMFCLESRETMPASVQEIAEAEEESIAINCGWGPKEILVDESGHVSGIVFKKCLSTNDETGRFNPQYDENDTITISADRIIFAIGQAIEWGNLLEGTGVTFWHGNYPVADKFTYQSADEDIFFGGDVYTGPKFVIDAIGQGHEAAESLARHVSRNNVNQTLGRDRRYFKQLDKTNIAIDSYDEADRQQPFVDTSKDYGHSFEDPRGIFTEEQVKTETGRCLSCGATIIDPNKCIGCGLCTTRCQFDAIHLIRDHPKASTMRFAEDKVTGLAAYAAPRALKILLHSGSEEARMMAKKRREYLKSTKEFRKMHKHTGNAVDINSLMDD